MLKKETGIIELRVRDVLEYLTPNMWQEDVLLCWPPDAFAACASLLQNSGSYTKFVKKRMRTAWIDDVTRIGRIWGDLAGKKLSKLLAQHVQDKTKPNQTYILREMSKQVIRHHDHDLLKSWNTIKSFADEPLIKAAQNNDFWSAIILICASADEACRGVGQFCSEQIEPTAMSRAYTRLLFLRDRNYEKFWSDTSGRIKSATACLAIDPSRAITLPKFHTPQVGLTLRALTHHIALCPGTEVRCVWNPASTYGVDHALNLLIIPWPKHISPSQFKPCADHKVNCNLPPNFGRFKYTFSKISLLERDLRTILKKSFQHCGDIDGVIMPELSLPSMTEYYRIRAIIFDELNKRAAKKCRSQDHSMSPPMFFVAGVQGAGAADSAKKNLAVTTLWHWIDDPPNLAGQEVEQAKQHSWKIDSSQIRTYNIGKQLDHSKDWWEHNNTSERNVHFFTLADWLCVCPVICEDLARPDPLIEMIHAVGPTLVIALLMDAPQLPHRWPGRYAMALADDPGSSVLTVTSLGMINLSSP